MKIPLTQDYLFNWLQETAWAIVIGVATVILPIVLATDIEMVEDWELWAAGIGIASARIVIAVGVNSIRKLLGIVTSDDT